ncbi:MAG: nucleotidyltransferase family protein [Clostridia bacterium]|nr:nucleotidyltransferase family protein [Clostridia bacterium]
MQDTKKLLFELIRGEVCGTSKEACAGETVAQADTQNVENAPPAEACDKLESETLAGLYAISKAHDMAHLLAEALDKRGLLGEAASEGNSFLKQRQMAVYRYEQINYEYERLCNAFEHNQIIHVPLKGALIRKLYPEPWLRTSCDIDILVPEAELKKAVEVCETKLGYKTEGKAYHDISMLSPGGVHLELHFNVCENIQALDEVLGRAWDYAIPVEGKKYEKKFTNEYFIFHNVAHASYHFLSGGCGIRSVLDLWLLRHKTVYEEAKVKELCAACGLEKFYDSLVLLSQVWFSGAEGNGLTDKMEKFILDGGVYGTIENGLSAKPSKKSGKSKYLFSLIFLPYKDMKAIHPVLGKHKWLLPFFHIGRWFKILFRGISPRTKRAMRVNAKISDEDRKKVGKLLEELELL